MNWDRIQGNWKQLTGKVQEQWGKLTNDDLDVAQGRRDLLAGRIQERYGITRDEADSQISAWESRVDDRWLGGTTASSVGATAPSTYGDSPKWDRVEGNWKQLKGKVKEQWGKLTDDDLDVAAGKRDQFVGRVQERYGIARDEADRQVRDWESRYDDRWLTPSTGTATGATTAAGTTGATGAGTLLTGVFRDRDSAEAAYAEAKRRGYSHDDIDLVMSDDTRKRHFGDGAETELGNKAAEGAGVGAGIGGTIGAIAAAIAAAGTSLALPGLGLVIAGPLAAAAAGAGVGAASGGLIGALVGWNMPEDRVKEYEQDVRDGGIVMGVRTRTDEDRDALHKHWSDNRGQRVLY